MYKMTHNNIYWKIAIDDVRLQGALVAVKNRSTQKVINFVVKDIKERLLRYLIDGEEE